MNLRKLMRFITSFISLFLWLTGVCSAQSIEQKSAGQALPNVFPDVRVAIPSAVRRFQTQRIAVKVPLGWQSVAPNTNQAGMLASFFAPNAFGATLSLAYSEDPGRTKLPDDLPALISSALAKRYPGFQQLAKQRLVVQGADAWRMDGQVKPEGKEVMVRNRQVYVCHEGRIYIVTLTCKKEDFERLEPSLDRFLKGLEWLD